MTQPTPAGAPRIHGLDALRGGALLLGIVLHGLLCFVAGFPWIVNDPQTSPVAGALSIWIHLFRMPLFMFLAGFFARMSVGRRQTAGFVRDRLLRIGLPFLVFAPLMLICIIAVVMATGSAPAPDAASPPSIWLLLSPGHLWFLWTLLQLYAIVLVVRAAVRRSAWARRVGDLLGAALTLPGGVLLAALPYWAGMEITRTIIGGQKTLLPELGPGIAFLGAFLVGWFCWGLDAALPRLVRQWPAHLALALALTALFLGRVGSGRFDMEATVSPWWLRAACAVCVWAWVYGLLGLCTAAFRRPSPAARYLADASYWMYILHLPLVLVMQALLAHLPLWWPLKLALIVGVPVALLLLSYHFLVRPTWVGAWLNGRRYPITWPRRARTQQPSRG